MPIDAAYLETLAVEWYESQSSGRDKINAALVGSSSAAREFKSGVESRLSSFLDFSSGNKLMYVRYAFKLKQMLISAIKAIGIHLPVNMISYSGPWTDSLGVVHVDVMFNEEYLWRESLCQNANIVHHWKNYATKNGKYGTDNILLQFETGWNASGSVFGVWKNKQIVASRRSRAPTYVLYNTIVRYNNQYKDILFANLLSPYNVK